MLASTKQSVVSGFGVVELCFCNIACGRGALEFIIPNCHFFLFMPEKDYLYTTL